MPLTPITHYCLEFNPFNHYMRISISTSTGSGTSIQWKLVPVSSLEEYVAISTLLRSGNCVIDQNGTIVLSK